MILASVLSIAAQDSDNSLKDFPFVTRGGESTTLFAEIDKITLSSTPDSLLLLLFDPDCDDCHALIEQLSESGVAKVIAIYPVDEPLADDDPNLIAYYRACAELPQEWIVGIDNGFITADDLYTWEHLPLLLPIPPTREQSLTLRRQSRIKNEHSKPYPCSR